MSGSPDPRPLRRKVATSAQWRALHDVADNLVPLCGTGTTGCHGLVEAFDPWACSTLAANLTDAEVAYVADKKGAGFLERRYLTEREAA